jgi:hypothetical protein
MPSQTLSSMYTSFQENSWSGISGHLQVTECLRQISSGKYKSKIDQLREYLDKGETDLYDREKRRLPAVTFSASFNLKRNRSSISVYNQLLVLDIDKLEKDAMTSLKTLFRNDPYIISFWESPSGVGLKGLVYLDFVQNFPLQEINFRHTYGFRKVHEYLKEKYGVELDKSGSDVTRLCFFSSDPSLFIRDQITSFPIRYTEKEAVIVRGNVRASEYAYAAEPTTNQKFNPAGKNSQLNRTEVQAIIRHLSKRERSITSSFHSWYQISYALANTFTYELGVKYFLSLSRLDGKRFNEHACKNMIDYCYANSMGKFSFATVVHFAKQMGYKEKKEVPKVAETL